jgi:hypothetical protein
MLDQLGNAPDCVSENWESWRAANTLRIYLTNVYLSAFLQYPLRVLRPL